ncbi:MAG: site-specific integrase [Magnetococcales bacterium]|nr:site-specific integrase [Magnetococcales bacterium]
MATIRKNKSDSWEVMIRKKGYPTATKTFRRKVDAQDWSRRIEDEMVRGAYIDRNDAERLLLADALDRYLKEISPRKAVETARSEVSRSRHLVRELGKFSLVAITPDKIYRYRMSREKAGASANQIRLEMSLLSHLFTTAIQDWHMGVPFNPVLNVKKPSPKKAKERRVSLEEQERLLNACRENPNPMLTWIVEIAIETAMRRGEILTLERSQIDMKKRTIFLEMTKNGSSRMVPMTARATEIFSEALNWEVRVLGSDLLFYGEPGRDGKRRPYTINRVWNTARSRAGLGDVRFHDLRHEATSRMVESGMSDQQVSAINGHKSMQMLKRYTHLRAADLVAVLDSRMGIAVAPSA